MSRIRLNSEYRNKGAVRFREHLEQENTQEKRSIFSSKRISNSFAEKYLETC